ncbi:hypothetical protein FQN54_005341 [Arachnomyces sp. PD_36]|nr:hypothetical protein FQN54_005341 [Arachnomyces sp. PD_36]
MKLLPPFSGLTSSNIALSGVLLSSLLGPVTGTPSSLELQNILKNTDRSDAYGYPTDLTRGILPIPVHSHNDYWRDVPFYTGLSVGCISTEADVWLINGTLYVGHDESSLTESRTLGSLYIDPILDVLERQNPTNIFVPEPTKNGVFDTDRSQTLYLFIDLKTGGEETWPAVLEALSPLRDAGYLTTLEGNKTLTTGPVTVIGTGNTPMNLVAPIADRDYFIDGPLADIDSPDNSQLSDLISPIASTNFEAVFGSVSGTINGALNDEQLKTLRRQVKLAKERGIGVRYWGAPQWPIRTRNELWKTLVDEGVALLNVDDLEATAQFF